MPDTENNVNTNGNINLTMTATEADLPKISFGVNAAQTVQAPVDATLSVSGKAADAKVTGDRLNTLDSEVDALTESDAAKVVKPATDGTAGQVLQTNGDGTTAWIDRALPTDEQTAEAVSEWLDEHPEATTTVEDASITEAKLATGLATKVGKIETTEADVASLKSALGKDEITSLLLADPIPDTVQAITFDASGNVQTITHSRDGATVRTDAFTFTDGSITETRTLATGESLTIVTNTDTLVTTSTYAEETA